MVELTNHKPRNKHLEIRYLSIFSPELSKCKFIALLTYSACHKSALWRNIFIKNIYQTFCFKNTLYSVSPISSSSNAFGLIKFEHSIPEIYLRYSPFTDMSVNCSLVTFQHFSAINWAFMVTINTSSSKLMELTVC